MTTNSYYVITNEKDCFYSGYNTKDYWDASLYRAMNYITLEQAEKRCGILKQEYNGELRIYLMIESTIKIKTL